MMMCFGIAAGAPVRSRSLGRDSNLRDSCIFYIYFSHELRRGPCTEYIIARMPAAIYERSTNKDHSLYRANAGLQSASTGLQRSVRAHAGLQMRAQQLANALVAHRFF